MSKHKDQYRIESARLKEWDYSNPWWYYITINIKDHKHILGQVIYEKMVLNELGKITKKYWNEITNHFKNVELDYFVIMPNHIHGIIIINTSVEVMFKKSK